MSAPKIAFNPDKENQIKSNSPDSFYSLPICWRIGRFDIESKWGLNSAKGKLTFTLSDELLQLIIDNGDNELYEVIDELQKLEFKSLDNFIYKIHDNYRKLIDPQLIKKIVENASFNFIVLNILPKLKEFENLSWNELDKDRHGKKGKSKHHFIDIAKLIGDAQKRLQNIGLSDLDQIYSLRLEGKLRLYGLRKQNCFEIVWVDTEHEICPTT